VLDEGLPSVWPADVQPAAYAVRQGDVLELTALYYLADTRHPVWVLTRKAAEDAVAAAGPLGVEILDLNPDVAPHLVIVTSQTCDIGEEAPPNEWELPWIQVSPVYRIAGDSPLRHRDYIVALTATSLSADGFIADLRIEMPVEKGMLPELAIQPGFANEADAVSFGELLGRRRQRAAVASSVNRVLRGTLQKKMQNNKSRWHRVRLEIHKLKFAVAPSRSEPLTVQLYVCSQEQLSADARQWFEEWQQRAKDAAGAEGLVLGPVGYMFRENFDLALYDSLIELDVRS